MSLTALAVAVLLTQSPASLAVAEPTHDRVDVAYDELSAGKAQDALRKLEAAGAPKSDDPATLINLGAAYAANGQNEKALASYRAAINTSERYDLQLADGTWADSRFAARRALGQLLRANAQASR